MTEEYYSNMIKGMKWIPIQEKAMKILKEFEKRNEKNYLYKIGLSDILYYALVLFYDDIINYDGDVYDLIGNISDEFIQTQRENIGFIVGYGALNMRFEKAIDEMRKENENPFVNVGDDKDD